MSRATASLIIILLLAWALFHFGQIPYNNHSNFPFSPRGSHDPGDLPPPPAPESPDQDEGKELPKVLLISYDGFRWDYLKRAKAPNLKWLIQNGVHATEGLKNTFITITAPNHYGIVTGLYEESHGIVANNFFDPVLNETFDYFTTNWKTDPRFFRRGEPVWVTNDRAADGRRTGCVMWVGCDVPIKGHMPKFWLSWNQSIHWEERIDKVISWFTHPERPINMGLLYIEEPDETGHNFGASSDQVIEMVEKLDELTAYLLWSLYRNNLLDKVNLIFTADHGMADVPENQFVIVDSFVNASLYTLYGGGPNWNVLPNNNMTDFIYDHLKNASHIKVYKKADIPAEYHYANTAGVMPLQIYSDEHWGISHHPELVETFNEKTNTTERIRTIKLRGKTVVLKSTNGNATWGEHGYNNSLPDMHPYFIGHGPAFKKGYNVTQFMNLDLYPLMCYILGIEPAPNNGSFDRVRDLLLDEGAKWKGRKGSKQNWHDDLGLRSRKAHEFLNCVDDALKPECDVWRRARTSGGGFPSLSYRYGFYVDLLCMLLILLFYITAMSVCLARASRQIGAGRREVNYQSPPITADMEYVADQQKLAAAKHYSLLVVD